jgi:hypothetical protein
MPSSNPTLAIEMTIEDPPELIKGSVTPVYGTTPVVTPMLMSA